MATNAPSGPPSARQVPPGTRLIPMNLELEEERKILYDQRIVCGWNEDKIPKWQKSMAEGTRTFFWIGILISSNGMSYGGVRELCERLNPSASFAPDFPQQPIPPSLTRDGTTFIPAGHVALDKHDLNEPDVMPDTTLANPAEGILTITSLFVLPVFGRNGLGAFAMSECERLCRVPPYGSSDCVAITVNTLSSRYCVGGPPGPDNTGIWERIMGRNILPQNNTPWYERRGYKIYKYGPRYKGVTKNGEEFLFDACFLRRDFTEEELNRSV